MTKEQAAERMRVAIASGVINIDDVIALIGERERIVGVWSRWSEITDTLLIDLLNTLLNEHNVLTNSSL